MDHEAKVGTIAIIGGTGAEGRGLATRFTDAGRGVIIGSRSPEKARLAAKDLEKRVPHARIAGMTNEQAAEAGDVIFVTVPYEALTEVTERLSGRVAGKVIVSTLVPIVYSSVGIYSIPIKEGSAALEMQHLLPEAKVVAAFQTISAKDLVVPDKELSCDVPVCSDYQDAKEAVMSLVKCVGGVRAIDGGPLENSRYVEGITVFLLNINRIYGGIRSGIKITGIFEPLSED